MTIKHMKIFVAVYNNMNITRAAEQLYMTQPAVTRAIQEIESYYGLRLFERINRRLVATETGKSFYSRALHISNSFDDMEKEMKNWDEFGVLRVGASVTLGNSVIPACAAEFKKLHPDSRLKITIANNTTLQSALIDDKIDIALIEGVVSEKKLISEKFAVDRLVLIASPHSELLEMQKLTLAYLSGQPLLLREPGSAGRTIIDSVFTAHGLNITPDMESTSTQAIIRAVGNGLGISFLPEYLVRDYIESGYVATRPVDDASFERNNYIVRYKNKFMTGSANEFIALIKATPHSSDGAIAPSGFSSDNTKRRRQ